jgi:hypothetical protein
MGHRKEPVIMRTRIGLGFAVLLATAACTNSVFVTPGGSNDDAGNVPGNGGGGGQPDAGGPAVDAAPPPPGCDTSKLPTDDACVVNDAEGVFVSSSLGKATGDGTKQNPIGSLSAGIDAAKKANKRVYACAETYAEQVRFQDGVDVFGYFDCNAGWIVGSTHALVRAPASPAATASNVTTPTRVEAVDLASPDFTDQSQSSIALVANASPALRIVHATIHAGTGGAGADGADGIKLTDSGSAKNGAAGTASYVCAGTICLTNWGGAGGTNVCTGASGHDPGPGGSGGKGGQYRSQSNGLTYEWDTIIAASAGNPTAATTQTAQGGTVAHLGNYGSAGAAGTDGTSGAAIGSVSANGYAPSDGTAGTDGQPGQGGGGAGAASWIYQTDWNPNSYPGKYGWGESGPGGGAGGCPGLASAAGKGGGASIAIVAIQSPLTLDTVIVESSAGGAGGKAGVPSLPLSGGAGGAAGKDTQVGGLGGRGGFAGISGNGGGGPSIGIASQGSAPQQLGSTVKVSAGGAGVAARTLLQGGTIPASPDGTSSATYAF